MPPDDETPQKALNRPRKLVKRDSAKPRTKKFVIRLRPEEHAQLSMHAENHGLTLTELCRHRLLEWQIPRPGRDVNDSKLYGVLSQLSVSLRNAGNNLNQLTKTHHLGFPIEESELMQAIREVQAQVDTLRLEIDPVGPAFAHAPKGHWKGSWVGGFILANKLRKPHGS